MSDSSMLAGRAQFPKNHRQAANSSVGLQGPFSAIIDLHIDARDTQRSILHVRETLRVAKPGKLTLLYPEWLPGFHAPEAPLESVAGLRISYEGRTVEWERDPVKVHAFHLKIPKECKSVDIEFQLLCPTAPEQGRIGMTKRHLNLQWNSVLLYPSGMPARSVGVLANVILPDEWNFACALEGCGSDKEIGFKLAPLDVVVDSPLFAGRNYSRYELDDRRVALNVFGDEAAQTQVGDSAILSIRNLIAQADKLFENRQYQTYEFLIAVSNELGDLGVEHHESSEIVLPSNFFTEWDVTRSKNEILAHEYVHSWNGKFRRGRDSRILSYDEPIQNSLMWVYEGLTQYWGQVLSARSGLWTEEIALGALARTAARCRNMAGRQWRPLRDTTTDPIIFGRKQLPWESWQRNEDYYTDGQLIWLDVDTLIREFTDGERSLDDFGRAFFGMETDEKTIPYVLSDVLSSLQAILPYDWESFFESHLSSTTASAPLAGIHRGGYELQYRDRPTEFHTLTDELSGLYDLTFSIGLSVKSNGKIKEVIWDSPSFYAGLTAGAEILAVEGAPFSVERLKTAVEKTSDEGLVKITIKKLKHNEPVEILYSEGHRFPHLVPAAGGRLIDSILRPLS